MSSIVLRAATSVALGLLLSACGVAQTVSDGTRSLASDLFYRQVKSVNLDFDGRVALNTHSEHMTQLSMPTLVRVYQLRDGQTMEAATYDDLLRDGDHVLHAALLDREDLVIKPGEGARLNVPLRDEAKVVAVVALFHQPDVEEGSWRLMIDRDALQPDRARVIELGDNRLHLRALSEG